MSTEKSNTALASLKFARKATLGLLESIPEDTLCHQPIPGCNHALWVAGHIAMTDEYFMHEVGGKPLTLFEQWKDTFFMGSKPTGKLSDYPAVADVKAALHNNREMFLTWFASLDAKALAAPLPESLKDFAPNVATLGCTLAWHEGLHAGQLSMIRKSLGLDPVFG